MSRATNPIERARTIRGGLGLGTLVLVGAILAGCSGQAAAMAEATSQATRIPCSPAAATQAAEAIDAFGFDFYKSDLTSGGNAVVSPASIVLALSMAQAGAGGETASQKPAKQARERKRIAADWPANSIEIDGREIPLR